MIKYTEREKAKKKREMMEGGIKVLIVILSEIYKLDYACAKWIFRVAVFAKQ